jgi:thiamine pyrophosphate-dependent acetolactate synthase large subunit-like protein
MTCYIGSPDIDYAKAAQAFGVEGEVVKEPSELKGAIERGKRVVADGRPYLLDIHTWRDGVGAVSTWHPPYSVAEARSRRV